MLQPPRIYIFSKLPVASQPVLPSKRITFDQSGFEGGKIIGRLRPTGLRPKFMDQIENSGIHLPPTIFGIGERRRY